MANKNKLILLCAPSGTGKSTIARMLTATDNRFRHVQVLTTRKIRPNEKGRMEKVHVKLEKLKALKDNGELVNFNEKDDVYYGIKYETIDDVFNAGANPVLEWDLNNLNYWDDKFPVYKVILNPSSKDEVLKKLKDGRDPTGVRKAGVEKEIELINSKKVKGDITITNFNASLMDTVQKIRKAFFSSNKLN